MLALATALRWTSPADVPDLRPRPDALEYEEAARSLAEGRGYRLWIGGDAYPPRYPPGMSLLLAAATPLTGTAPGSGVRVVLLCALAGIAGTFVLTRSAGGNATGLAAALVVAVSPLHVLWSRAVISDVPATAAVAWIAAWTVAVLRRRAGTAERVALGVACGLTVCIRQPLALVAAAVCATTFLLPQADLRERLRRATATACGVLLGVAPLLAMNARLFGSPLRSGYGYWAPFAGFALGQATAARPHERPSNLVTYGAQLVGDGAFHPWTGGVLLVLGTLVALRLGPAARRLCAFTWLTTVLFTGVLATYSNPTNRLMLPLLPLLAATMSLALAGTAPAWTRRLGGALLAGSLLLLTSMGPEFLGRKLDPYGDTATLEKIAATTEPNAAVLAYTSPLLFDRVLRRDGADRIWIPLRIDEHMLTIRTRARQPLEHDPARGGWIEQAIVAGFQPARVVARIEELCRSGRPVYVSMQRAPRRAFLPGLERALRQRFGLTQVLPPAPWAVYRVECGPPGGGRSAAAAAIKHSGPSS
ncbi:MAG: hypothetical protein FJ148_27985 [Deltaproteobacteria bacterium]|nr:hypothetical protein [Deltaproteobacteria bacterium]